MEKRTREEIRKYNLEKTKLIQKLERKLSKIEDARRQLIMELGKLGVKFPAKVNGTPRHHEVRQSILMVLQECGPEGLTCREVYDTVCQEIVVTKGNVQTHLSRMKTKGVVQTTDNMRGARYSLVEEWEA